MESVYTREPVRRRSAARASVHGKKRRGGVALAPRERRRLLQLCICTVLFLVVFLGRGVFPERLEVVRGELLEVIRSDTDFEAAFTNLGRAIERREPVAEALGTLWTDIFSAGGGREPYVATMENTPFYQQEREFLRSNPDALQSMARRLGLSFQASETPTSTKEPESETSQPESSAQATLPPEPAPVYTGPPLPDNATMEQLPLGLEETAAPVMAAVSSAYGWREHPIEGGEKFHAGVDLAAPYGDPIGAFADGVVDYIGESPAYGLYLQLRHDGGVTSFYAHCSKLCVQQGQTVTLGEKIAEVGDTGETTGAHLHFELRLDGELLNPLYYIETV